METVNTNAGFLCNYEVMLILQQLKDNTQKKHKREGSLATVTYETVRYLQESECNNQNTDAIEKFLEATKCFKLTKVEKLMMVNTPPRTELEIQL
ncbi:unnamed protein product [Leptidea sinapis]|uniref:DNA-directed RNA polymerase III subunit RPC9 n=1 Tax=Leptidea sinapis TaxID=189913 RepID=A0A5E4QK31_9NEOP|nr:unnamed protein product [Leptidea sinapis]